MREGQRRLPSRKAVTVSETDSRRALVVRGGWDGHQPVEATNLFLPFLHEHFDEVRVEESTAVYADTDYLETVDLIVQSVTMSTIADDEFRGLQSAVVAGAGFAGWHGGIADSFRNNSDYLHLVGGQFATHPGKAPGERTGTPADNYVSYTVSITEVGATHPITAGVRDFELTTEQYWVLHDDYNDVLATTTQKVRPWDPFHREVTSPAIWTRQWGEGRVFVATPGHQVAILEQDPIRSIIERGLLWAAR